MRHLRRPHCRSATRRAPPAAVAAAAIALGTLAAAPALPHGGAVAQTVVGTVTERGTARPLGGAFVVLVDAEGRRGNGGLTGEDGAYRLRAAAPGRYRLVAELIGYASVTSDWVELAPGAALRHDIEVAVEAVTLEGIDVETGQRCRRRPGSGPETARLWEEARKALEVARWSEDQRILRFRVVERERTLEARTLRVLAEHERARSGYYDRSPYRSIPPARLHAGGYIQRLPDETYAYFAPDAEVLLSDSFLETHCFRVVPAPDDEPELIGLAFQPVPERRLPDVRGVLWLEKGSAELRRLDYAYENLPFRHGEWPQVGGRVELERLATGMWIVRRWHIRMPLEAESTGRDGALELVSLVEQGAEIRAVTTRGGTVIAEAVGATLYGTVTDGPDGPGVPDVVVEVEPADRRTTTAAGGAYRLTGLPSGRYTVRVRHAAVGPAALRGAEEREVELVSGRATRLVLHAPPPNTLAPRPPPPPMPASGGLVAGRVLDYASGRPVEGAIVTLADSAGHALASMVTDGTGVFRLLHAQGLGSGFDLEVRHERYASLRSGVRAARPPVRADVPGENRCDPAVRIDGAPAPADARLGSVAAVETIDIYVAPASGAAAGRSGGGCGVVVLWTRER